MLLQAKAFVGALKPTYWQALIVVCVIYFTRFDWSFVVLRAKQVRLVWFGSATALQSA